jgi:hypothetical protein
LSEPGAYLDIEDEGEIQLKQVFQSWGASKEIQLTEKEPLFLSGLLCFLFVKII